jgi:cytochrome c peroxidase
MEGITLERSLPAFHNYLVAAKNLAVPADDNTSVQLVFIDDRLDKPKVIRCAVVHIVELGTSYRAVRSVGQKWANHIVKWQCLIVFTVDRFASIRLKHGVVVAVEY